MIPHPMVRPEHTAGLDKGVEKGSINIHAMPLKADFCTEVSLLLLDSAHVVLAPRLHMGIYSTMILFGRSLIGTICVFVVASTKVPITHQFQCLRNVESIPNL